MKKQQYVRGTIRDGKLVSSSCGIDPVELLEMLGFEGAVLEFWTAGADAGEGQFVVSPYRSSRD